MRTHAFLKLLSYYIYHVFLFPASVGFRTRCFRYYGSHTASYSSSRCSVV